MMEAEMGKNILKEELEKMQVTLYHTFFKNLNLKLSPPPQKFSRESEEALYLFKKQTVERERNLTEHIYTLKGNETVLKGRLKNRFAMYIELFY